MPTALDWVQDNVLKPYCGQLLRCGTLGILALHVLRRPAWTYSPEHSQWDNNEMYPNFGVAKIHLEVAYLVDCLLSFLVLVSLHTVLIEQRRTMSDDRIWVMTNVATPVCIVRFVEMLVQVIFIDAGFQPVFSLSPLEVVLFIVCEPCFESSLYKTMYRSLSYFGGLMFLLVVVLVAWSVLAMVVLNAGKAKDPSFLTLGDTVWNMLTVLNTANWPNPVIPSYESNSAYFLFFVFFSVVVDWGLLNLVLGLVVAFFEEGWSNGGEETLSLEQHNDKLRSEIRNMQENPLHSSGAGAGVEDSAGEGAGTEMVAVAATSGGDHPVSASGLSSPSEAAASPPAATWAPQSWWVVTVGPYIENNKVFDLLTDLVLFVLGLNFVFGYKPVLVLNVQIVLNALELIVRMSVRKESMYKWLTHFRNRSNAAFIVVLFTASMTYFGLCADSGPHQYESSCGQEYLNDNMSPDMSQTIILLIITIRTCIAFRITLVLRNFTWDYIPPYHQKQLLRVSAIVLETSHALGHLVIMLLVIMYMFSAVGMQLWGGSLNLNPQNPRHDELMASQWAVDAYFPLNFNDMAGAFTTMFTLLYVNNMQIVTSGCSAVSSKYSQFFFAAFYVVGVLYIQNIFTSFLWSRIGKIFDPTAFPIDEDEDEEEEEKEEEEKEEKEEEEEKEEDEEAREKKSASKAIAAGASAGASSSATDTTGGGIGMPVSTQKKMKRRMTSLAKYLLDDDDEEDTVMDSSMIRDSTRSSTASTTVAEDNYLRDVEAAAVTILCARYGDNPKMHQDGGALWAFKLRSKLNYTVLISCWLLTLMRVFQTPPWIIDKDPSVDLADFWLSGVPTMTAGVTALIKVPLLMSLMVMLTLEVMSARNSLKLKGVAIVRLALMAICFSSMVTLLIGAAGEESARRVDWYLSFFSVMYTFWFDRNAMKRIIIVVGVIPKLLALVSMYIIFAVAMVFFGMFVFGLRNDIVSEDADDYEQRYYATFTEALWTLCVAITSSSFPSQFIPVMTEYKEFSLYMITVISIGGFVFLEGSIAVVNTAYQTGVTARGERATNRREESLHDVFKFLSKNHDMSLARQLSSTPGPNPNAIKGKSRSSVMVSVSETKPYVSDEKMDALFKEMYGHYGEFSKFGNPNGIERVILTAIMDLNGSRKIDEENFMQLMHVIRVKVKPVDIAFLTHTEKAHLNTMKQHIRIDLAAEEGNFLAKAKVWRVESSQRVCAWVAGTAMGALEKKHWDALCDSIAGVIAVFCLLESDHGSHIMNDVLVEVPSKVVHRSLVATLMLLFLLEFLVKWFILGINPYFRDLRNSTDFLAGVLMLVLVVAGDAKNKLFSKSDNFWSLSLSMVEMLRLLLYPRNVACFASPVNGVAWKNVMSTVAKLSFSFAEAFTAMGFTFAQLGVLLFGGAIPRAGVNAILDNSPFGHNNFYILNFNDMTSAFFTLFACLRISDWDVVSNGYILTKGPASRIFFLVWYGAGVLLMFNILKSYFVIVFRPKKTLHVEDPTDAEAARKEKEGEELERLEAKNVRGHFITDVVDLRIRGYKFHDGKDDQPKGQHHVYGDEACMKEKDSPVKSGAGAALEATRRCYQMRNHERYVITFPYKQNIDFQTRLSVLRRIEDLCLAAM